MKKVAEKLLFYARVSVDKVKIYAGKAWSMVDVRTSKAINDHRLLLNNSTSSRFPSVKQLLYLPKYLSDKEKVLVKRLGFVILACLIMLAGSFYWKHTQIVPKPGGSYIEGLVGAPQYINPVFSWANDVDRDLIALIFNGLVRQNNAGEYVGDLAESFEINEEKTVYTFHLRKNIKWHNGQGLTADDIIFTVGAIMDPEWRSPLIGQLSGVRVEKVDDYTVQFTLKEPTVNALALMSFGVLPEHLWSDVSGSSASLNELNKKPVGTGPFIFDSLTKDKKGNVLSMTLVKNGDYYSQQPYLDKITFKFYGDSETVASALANKNIQGLGTISIINKDVQTVINKNKDLVFYSLSLPQYVGVFFNSNKNEALKSQAVRQALAYAIDKQVVLESAVGDKGEVIDGPVLSGYLGYTNDQKKYNYNPASAGDLLDKAGWKKGDDGFRKKGDTLLSIKLTTSDSPEYQAAAQTIKESWQRAGVKVEIITVNKNRFKQDVIDIRAYEGLLFSIISNNNDLTSAWHSRYMSDRGSALSVLPNRDIDTLLDEARTSTDQEVVSRNYISLQNIIAETVPAIFLYNPTRLYPVNKKIQGLTTKRVSMPADRFIDIQNWYIKTTRKFFWKINK